VTRLSIPFSPLTPREDLADIRAAIARVLSSGRFILGPEVEAFEHEFADAAGAARAVGVGSGTDALALILRALGIGPGDEVITTPLSAAYTALAVLMAGARPVFADVDEERLTLDPDQIASAVTSRTKAVVPVHLYGQPADMDAIGEIASRHNLAVIEDCCQAHLATSGGRPVGTLGVAGAFSFYPTKNLGALGDGGAVVTNDRSLADRIRRLRNGGQSDTYQHDEAGVNSRLDELQAAVLRARLPFLKPWTAIRRQLAGLYRQELEEASVRTLREFDRGHVYHLFVVRSAKRADLQRHLTEHGVDTLVHYPVPVSRQRALGHAQPAACPNADTACEQVLSLPLRPSLTPAHVRQIAAAVCAFDARD
jgi:dTDP-4-amino-4,6-dideoxygalactose transaminase